MGRSRSSIQKFNRLLRILARDGFHCHYCRCLLVTDVDCRGRSFWNNLGLEPATIEHLIPRSVGGTNRLDNLVAACGKCNNHRSDNPQSFEKGLLVYHGERYIQIRGKWIKAFEPMPWPKPKEY